MIICKSNWKNMQIPVGPSPSTVLPGCSVFMTQHLRTTTWSGIPEPFFLFSYNKNSKHCWFKLFEWERKNYLYAYKFWEKSLPLCTQVFSSKNLPLMVLTSGFLGSGLLNSLGNKLFSLCHFFRHCGSWMEIDFVPYSRPQM